MLLFIYCCFLIGIVIDILHVWSSQTPTLTCSQYRFLCICLHKAGALAGLELTTSVSSAGHCITACNGSHPEMSSQNILSIFFFDSLKTNYFEVIILFYCSDYFRNYTRPVIFYQINTLISWKFDFLSVYRFNLLTIIIGTLKICSHWICCLCVVWDFM